MVRGRPSGRVLGAGGRVRDVRDHRSADARVALTWSSAVERGRMEWTCPACARRYVRGIEGRLDSDWW